jgi:uncharacterized protein
VPDLDRIFRPWVEKLRNDVGELEPFDAHTHIGANDPDGYRQRPEQLMEVLADVGARGVVFPMQEPAGYPPANDAVLEAAERSEGRLVPFCRVDPHTDAVTEARRCLDAGAAGIKLHPRAERFTLSTPGVRDLIALAHERRAPVLIHAGRGIPALGQDTIHLSGEFTDARLILAHCAISDLAWLTRVLPEHPNVLIDSAWWNPVDEVAMFTLVPPGHILWASDSPYGRPIQSIVATLRSALQAGLTPEQVRGVAGAQLARVVAGEELLDLGPPPGVTKPLDPLVERVVSYLTTTLGVIFGRGAFDEPLAIARLACAVGDDGPHAEFFAAILELLDLFEENLAEPPDGRPYPEATRLLVAALNLSRTPDVPLPELPEAPAPTRAEAEH